MAWVSEALRACERLEGHADVTAAPDRCSAFSPTTPVPVYHERAFFAEVCELFPPLLRIQYFGHYLTRHAVRDGC